MEFNINVNGLFTDTITKIDNRLQICRNGGGRFQDQRQQLFLIIDKMGEASFKAQGIHGPITTGRKLELSDHNIYIMTDPDGMNGQGTVVGILKVGHKKLFLYDRNGQQWEMKPLCILDFYIHESRQRMGCGRRLFDFMLKSENVSPKHLAVDRPSHKFTSFLAKHYGLQATIPQTNNFVIFEGFFTNRPDSDSIKNRYDPNIKPADYEYRATKSGFQGNPFTQNKMFSHNNSTTDLQLHNSGRPPLPSNSRPPSGQQAYRQTVGILADSRHTDKQQAYKQTSGILSARHVAQNTQETVLKDLQINPRPAPELSFSGTESKAPISVQSGVDIRSMSAGSNANNGLQLQNNLYQHHQSSPPVDQAPHHSSTLVQRPPSGKRNDTGKMEGTPPVLQRNGPPKEYLDAFNLHQTFQTRDGHLKVPSDLRVGTAPRPSFPGVTILPAINGVSKIQTSPLSNLPMVQSFGPGYYTQSALRKNPNETWTVAGVLRNQQQQGAKYYGHSRLW